MMRTLLLIVGAFAANVALAQSAGEFELGTHYNRLTPTQPTSSGPEQIEVAEIFWYGCPHCNTFDPYLNAWEMDKPEHISFVRVPAVWNPLVRFHAQAFYTAQVLGKGAEMHEAFFAEIHDNGNYLDSPDKLAAFFANFGVSRSEFAEAFNGREVNSLLQRAEELNERYQISSVPSIVVNGKYTTNASLAGSYDRLIALMDELAASERSSD
jgi:thiol:disulfide interchange protein DsbA